MGKKKILAKLLELAKHVLTCFLFILEPLTRGAPQMEDSTPTSHRSVFFNQVV